MVAQRELRENQVAVQAGDDDVSLQNAPVPFTVPSIGERGRKIKCET